MIFKGKLKKDEQVVLITGKVGKVYKDAKEGSKSIVVITNNVITTEARATLKLPSEEKSKSNGVVVKTYDYYNKGAKVNITISGQVVEGVTAETSGVQKEKVTVTTKEHGTVIVSKSKIALKKSVANIIYYKGDFVDFVYLGKHYAGRVKSHADVHKNNVEIDGINIGTVSVSKALVTRKEYKSHQYFAKGAKVDVAYTGSKYTAVVMEASITSEDTVRIQSDATKSIFNVDKKNVTLAKSATYNIYTYNDKVLVKIDGIEKPGVVEKYSGIYDEQVHVKIPKIASIRVSKNLVRKKPIVKYFFKDNEKATDAEKHMAKLFQAKTHTAVVNLAIEGIDLSEFDIVIHEEYYAAIPKGLEDTDKIPCLIAHTDLHPNLTHPTVNNLEYEDGTFSSATGLGADDRAGVFAIHQLLKEHLGEFMFLFPDKEEIGCVGSRAFGRHDAFKPFEEKASVFISIDRRREFNGDKSLATYGADNTELNKWVSKLTDRKILRGSNTDCKALSTASETSKANIPCFNLSCGYDKEHSKEEYLVFSELLDTIDDLRNILSDDKIKDAYVFTPTVYGNYNRTYQNNQKSKNNKTKETKTAPTEDDFNLIETIEHDGSWFFEEDIEALLAVYAYFNGMAYDSENPILIPKLEQGDFVRVDPSMSVNKKYGGQTFTQDMKNSMKDHVWSVAGVNSNGNLTLKTTAKDGKKYTCTMVPRRWVQAVLNNDPFVEEDKKAKSK